MRSGVIITGSREDGSLFIESVTYPDGTTSQVLCTSHYGKQWCGSRLCDAYSVCLSDPGGKEVYLYHHNGRWAADDEAPDWLR